MSWRADVITLYPEMFPGSLSSSLAGRALEERKWTCQVHDLRHFGLGRHRAVDDTPFGGGAGMVLRADILAQALDSIALEGRAVICPTPRGRRLTQSDVVRLAAGEGVIVVCGRFEGIDERFFQRREVEQFAFGDFVLSGGEIPALALLDACIRLLPGVMGSTMSHVEESFEDGLLEYPHYTRPITWEGISVPAVLRSGHHAAISAWRKEQSVAVTKAQRPDLWALRAKSSSVMVDSEE